MFCLPCTSGSGASCSASLCFSLLPPPKKKKNTDTKQPKTQRNADICTSHGKGTCGCVTDVPMHSGSRVVPRSHALKFITHPQILVYVLSTVVPNHTTEQLVVALSVGPSSKSQIGSSEATPSQAELLGQLRMASAAETFLHQSCHRP